MSAMPQQLSTTSEPLLTVVVPVYNAMPYLAEFLDSLIGQDLEPSNFRVLIVDDGSTDEGPNLLDTYSFKHPNFQVLHEENSGWPGTPRNLGLSLAQTKYVFFSDSDDVLAPSCLRLLLDYAEEHASDIVIPQLAGMAGRKVPQTKATTSTEDLDLVSAFRTLGPIKLYRRSLLWGHSIKFPSNKVRLEDGIFNAQAYLAARRVSVLAGEDNYYVRSRDDGNNISVQPLDPHGYTESLAKMCRIVNSGSLNETTRIGIILGLFQRKCLKIYRPGRFIQYKDSRRSEWVSAHRSFIKEFITPEMESQLGHPFDVRTQLVRTGNIDALLRLQKTEESPSLHVDLTAYRILDDNGLHFEMDVTVEGALGVDQMVCELWRRTGNGHAAFPLRAVGERPDSYALPRPFKGIMPPKLANDLVDGTYDFYVRVLIGKDEIVCRVPVHKRFILDAPLGYEVYATVRGNLSMVKK